MLDLAHASLFHWGIAGGPRERAVGEWQVARVYASLNEPGMALRFAEACLATCQTNGLVGELATAYEGIARAHGVAGRTRLAREFLGKAREALEAAPVERGDRKVYLDQIRDTERKIGRD